MAKFSFPVLISPVSAQRKETSSSREHWGCLSSENKLKEQVKGECASRRSKELAAINPKGFSKPSISIMCDKHRFDVNYQPIIASPV